MKFYLAALVAVAFAEDPVDPVEPVDPKKPSVRPEDMAILAHGFLEGLGLSEDVGTCFDGAIGEQMADGVRNMLTGEQCNI